MQFETREQYIIAATQWKAEYEQLSKKIRAIKHQIKEESRAKGFTYAWSALASAKTEAQVMLGVRQESKIEAQRQYLAQRQV